MTLFLASVANESEAEIAISGGVDLIDFADLSKETLGGLQPELVRSAVEAVAGRRQTSAVAGDPSMKPARLSRAVECMAATGVDYVRIGLSGEQRRAAFLAALASRASASKLIGVLFADEAIDLTLIGQLADAGFAGAMLDTAREGAGRLLDHRDTAWLSEFVKSCWARGLLAGFAGALEPPDVPRLLPLRPDILGFRGALDPKAVELVRALIRAEIGGRPARDDEQERGDYRIVAGGDHAVEPDETSRTDRIFVRDLVVPVRIGAYRSERDANQRVRFNVDAFVERARHGPADMRDILSYDVITDAIRRIVAEGHVELVEIMAERIADVVLGQPRVSKVLVRVEKLDIGPAAVGVAIMREKTAKAAVQRPPVPPASSER